MTAPVLLHSTVGTLTEPITGRHWGRTAVLERVAARAGVLQRRGLRRSDRVFIHHGNNLEFFADLLAVWWLGGCAIPLDERLTPFEVETLAAAATPRFSLVGASTDQALASRLEGRNISLVGPDETADFDDTTLERSPLSLDDHALILFTSGTTGQPKGVIHTHRSLQARWVTLRDSLGLSAYRRTLCLLPTHFGHGLICNSLFPWMHGADLFVLPPFRADLVTRLGDIIDEHRITFLSSVPAVWRLALKLAAQPRGGTLERVHCGSAPLSGNLWGQIRAWAGTPEVFNAYGITETGSWVAGTNLERFTPEDGLIGRPWGATVRILADSSTRRPPPLAEERAPGEEGYVWLNTPALMQGYLDREDLTSAVVVQGWFMTGDIGVVDDRGLLYLRGREREEINRGGAKVYPGDVDGVAERIPGVADVCTFAVEDPLLGQNVGIALVVEGDPSVVVPAVRAGMQEMLAHHQMPVRWYVVEAIPRTSRGKINREHVAETCRKLSQFRFAKGRP